MPAGRGGFTGNPYNQDEVNAWWTESGQEGPPPVVPSSLAGMTRTGTRFGPRLTGADGKSRPYTQEERDFDNFWTRTSYDPYRQQSGVSQLAGGLIGAGFDYVGGPVAAAIQAVDKYGNKALGTNDTTVSRDGVSFGTPTTAAAPNTAASPNTAQDRPIGSMAQIGQQPTYAPLSPTAGQPNTALSSNLAGSPGFTGTPAGTPMVDTKKLPKGVAYQTRDPWFTNTAQAALGRATQMADRPYTPFEGERVAGLSANEQQAGAMAAAPREYTNQIDRLGAGYTPEAISGFMNPYVDSVLGARTREIGNNYTTQMAGLDRNAAATDAFRSGRSDRQRSRLQGSQLRAIDEATNDTKKSAFENAQQAYFNQGSLDTSAIGAIEGANRSRVGSLSETGAADRSVRQAEDDFNYGEHLERRDWDMNNLDNLLKAIGAVNSAAGTYTYGGNKDKKSDEADYAAIAGAIASAYGEYNSSGGGG